MIAAEATATVARQMAGEPAGQVRQQRLPVDVAIAEHPVQEHQRGSLAVHGPADGDAVAGGDVVGALVAHVRSPCASCGHACNDDADDVGEHHPTGYVSAARGVLQVAAGNLCGEIRASVDVHLGVDVGQVLLDRVDGDEQALTDLGVGVAFGDQPHDVAFDGSQ